MPWLGQLTLRICESSEVHPALVARVGQLVVFVDGQRWTGTAQLMNSICQMISSGPVWVVQALCSVLIQVEVPCNTNPAAVN